MHGGRGKYACMGVVVCMHGGCRYTCMGWMGRYVWRGGIGIHACGRGAGVVEGEVCMHGAEG